MILTFQQGVRAESTLRSRSIPNKVTNGCSDEKSFIQGYDANRKTGGNIPVPAKVVSRITDEPIRTSVNTIALKST